MYAARYPQLPRDRWCLIENGYDEQSFQEAEALVDPYKNKNGAKVLLHSGLLYLSERNPTAFFDALAELQQEGRISPEKLQVVFRASGHTEEYRALVSARGLGSLVRLEPPIAYREALAEMLGADGLLLFQASNCNEQIPAKAYEYLRAGKPILALTDEAGDTAAVLRATPSAIVVPMDSRHAIKEALPRFLDEAVPAPTQRPMPTPESNSRRERTYQLARLLDGAVPSPTTAGGTAT
jgi:glycosyltransferase involved in cell wall biosynthesis